TQSPTTGVALLGNPSATSTVPSPISTKRSGSIPHPPAPYNNRGNVWYAQRDFDRAIADFDQAIRLNSELADAYNGQGRAWLAQHALYGAIAASDLALNAYYNRAAIWGKKGYFNRAIAEFDAALKIFPNHARSLYGRGLVKLLKGDASGNADIAAAKAIQA